MTRLTLSLMTVVLTFMTATAQQLPGTWTHNLSQSGLTTQSRFHFNADQTLHVDVKADLNRNDIGDISCHGGVDGVWEQRDSVLTINLDMESFDLEFDHMEFAPAIAELIGQGSAYSSRLSQTARSVVAGGLRREFGDGDGITLRITVLTDRQLQVRNDRTRHTLDFSRE